MIDINLAQFLIGELIEEEAVAVEKRTGNTIRGEYLRKKLLPKLIAKLETKECTPESLT